MVKTLPFSFLLFFIGYKKLPLPTAKQFGWIILLALLMFVGANGLSTWSLNYIPTGLSALIGALYPLSVVLIEIIFYKKNNEWKFNAIGEPTKDKDLKQTINTVTNQYL